MKQKMAILQNIGKKNLKHKNTPAKKMEYF